ncbi:40S ribosomal protein S6 [Vulpes lagopus]
MKLNISFPATGCQKPIEMDDELKLHNFNEKRLATEAAADALGKERKGYVVRTSGGNYKQGFPMKQVVLTHGCAHLLLSKGHSCYQPRRTGERKHQSVGGCIVDANHSVLNLVIVKEKGRKIFLDRPISLCLIAWGPKESAESENFLICQKKMMSTSYVVRKPLNRGKNPTTKAPRIQRLVTTRVLQHKHRVYCFEETLH